MGGDNQVKHILNWWHISMRIRHVEATVQGLIQAQGSTGIPVLFQRQAKATAGGFGLAEHGSPKLI